MKSKLLFLFLLLSSYAFTQDTTAFDSQTVITAHDTTVADTTSNLKDGVTDITLPLLEDWFSDIMPVIMTVLISLIAQFSNKIPYLRRITDTGLRVIAIATAVGIAYVLGYGGDVWEVALSYLASIVGYHTILRPATRSAYKNKVSK